MAKRMMEQTDACVVITGEIVGQRPMSQKKHQLAAIDRRSGLHDRLLRPLSAKLLPPTAPEREGLIDREQLYDISGRSRVRLIELAEELGVADTPTPSTGCALTERSFTPRVRDLLEMRPDATRWEFELLNYGRHMRLSEQTKCVVGRDAAENAILRMLAVRDDAAQAALMMPNGFTGPDVLVVGHVDEAALRQGGALLLRYARRGEPGVAEVRLTGSIHLDTIAVEPGDVPPPLAED